MQQANCHRHDARPSQFLQLLTHDIHVGLDQHPPVTIEALVDLDDLLEERLWLLNIEIEQPRPILCRNQ